jgi:leucyl aminopeptidase
MSIYLDNIDITNKIDKNNKNIIVVSSKSSESSESSKSDSNANILIKNSLDILLKSSDIKDFLSNIHKGDVQFNLQKLDKVFVKGFVYSIIQGLYVFNKYKSIKKKDSNIIFYAPQLNKVDIDNLFSIINYSNLSRNIINEPSNIFTPEKLGAYACGLFSNAKYAKYVKVDKYNHSDIKRMGLRLIDAVGGTSRNKPCFIVLDYKPPNCKKTICLVGKGVTIDTGGYSMKSGDKMEKMYMDKEGAALSIGLFKYFVDSKSKHRIVCLCPSVENIVSDISLKPNDIIKSYNGTTVEIVNTDAEGRLILADALAYACKNYKPDYIFEFRCERFLF